VKGTVIVKQSNTTLSNSNKHSANSTDWPGLQHFFDLELMMAGMSKQLADREKLLLELSEELEQRDGLITTAKEDIKELLAMIDQGHDNARFVEDKLKTIMSYFNH